MLYNIFTVGLAAILLGLKGSEAAHATCYNLTIPVPITATNTNLSLPLPVSQSQVIDFATASASIDNNITNYVEGNYTLDATYNISARLCVPTYAANSNSSTNRNDTVQFLIHGIGFDKSYWDLPSINGVNYSYTEAALAKGYATFAIDRLGVGLSNPTLWGGETIDPINEIQTPAHIEVVHQLTNMLRNGSIPNMSNISFESVIHVGHSYGSIISNGLVAQYPNASDGLILQGYSANGSWVPQTIAGLLPTIAAQDQPFRFINASTGVALNSGYLLSNNIWNNQLVFYKSPAYDPLVLGYAEFTKQTFTIGELYSLSGGIKPSQFTGPVLIVTGEHDYIFCGGYCPASSGTNLTSIPAGAQDLFTSASNFSVYLPPGTGHAVNTHRTAWETYTHQLNWLLSVGF